jgi:hypothetical protein
MDILSLPLQFLGCVLYPLKKTFSLPPVNLQQADTFCKDPRVNHSLD